MIELLDEGDGEALVAGAAACVRQAVASRGHGDPGLVARIEGEVVADPARAIRFDGDGAATLHAAGHRYRAGRFEVASLAALGARALAARAAGGAGRPAPGRRLWLLGGDSPATDIGTLQASAAPGSLFQVASQFNCLEAPGASVVPIARYFGDSTQGPRASISAFPGTFVRHYAAPAADGARFVQTSGRQLELLAGVCEPGVARVVSGYLQRANILRPDAFARALEERFDAIAVGVHDGVEVTLGHDWLGRVDGAPDRAIAQVFTSTLAGGGYGGLPAEPHGSVIVRQLQRAAYLGTLLAAAALGTRRVCLTMIGGGVFGNPHRAIWDAILWASDEIVPYLREELSIVVNSRSVGGEPATAELVAATRARGGGVIRVADDAARLLAG